MTHRPLFVGFHGSPARCSRAISLCYENEPLVPAISVEAEGEWLIMTKNTPTSLGDHVGTFAD
jgi:hypothetical protein